MTVGSMNALMGASNAQKLTSIPINVYEAAERKGDTATMERAMGYAQDCTTQAMDYSKKAQEELVKEQKAERKEQEARLKEAIENRRAENKGEETPQTKNNAQNVQSAKTADSIEISEDAKNLNLRKAMAGETVSPVQSDTAAIYTPAGNAVSLEQATAVVDVRA